MCFSIYRTAPCVLSVPSSYRGCCPSGSLSVSKLRFLQLSDLLDKNKKSEPFADRLQVRISPIWKGRAKKMPTFSSAFGVYHPRSQGYITQETRTISPAGLSSIMKVCIIFSFCSEIKRPSATQGNGVAKQQALSMGGFSHTRRKETKNHTGTSDTTNLAKSQEKTY